MFFQKFRIRILFADSSKSCRCGEEMIDLETDQPHTSHTLNSVPVILISDQDTDGIINGTLADIAPTLLELMGLAKPAEMTGQSLLERR